MNAGQGKKRRLCVSVALCFLSGAAQAQQEPAAPRGPLAQADAAATEGVIKAWISNLAHKENTATAIGFYTSCESICALLASIIAGTIWTNWGSSSTFIATSVVSFIVFIYFLLKIRRN